MSGHIQLEPFPSDVGRHETLQLTIRVFSPSVANPFTDAQVIGTFTPNTGQAVNVRGFCDAEDGTIWRVRFCPREIGAYRFTLSYQDARMRDQVAGGFVCHPSQAPGFVRIDPDHPYHFIRDNGTHPFLAGKTAWRLGCSPHWREFIAQAAVNRMNVLRVGVECPYFRELAGGDCWLWGGTRESPDFSRFNLAQWQHWDQVLRYTFEQGCLIEVCIFTGLARLRASPPIPDPDMERYWDYLIARWSAYPGILLWELYNEFTELPDYQSYMARFLKTHDPYGHPVTTSGQQIGEVPFPETDWNDLVVPHFCVGSWHHLHGFYHDWASRLHVYNKPVFVDETGRAISPQNNTDGIHRRKQYWIWAIAGDYCNYHSEGGCYVDLSLEPGEEFWSPYVTFWETTRWWEMVPADERIVVAPPGILGVYCLWSPAETIVYLYTKKSGANVSSGALQLRFDAGHYRFRFYHPASGSWDEGTTIEHTGGTLAIACPGFRDDLAIRLTRV
jgi:hypothetical protein